MTTPQSATRAAVRRASLVDVPAVARLATSAPASLPLPSENGEAPERARGRMQSALRLMMAHHALEDGQVWVGEQVDGTLLAASIWLPPDADIEPATERFGPLFSRELHSLPPRSPDLSGALKAACPDRPHWKIIVFCGADHVDAWSPELARELLTPGLDVVDEQDAAAVAITLSADQLEPIQPLGFAQSVEVLLAPEASVWLMTRENGMSRTAADVRCASWCRLESSMP